MAPAIAVKPVAPGALEYHCTVGAAHPGGVVAVAVNVAVAGALTEIPSGWVSTWGLLVQPGGRIAKIVP